MIEETTLLEENAQTKNLYEVSPEMQRRARAKLEKIVQEKGVKRFTKKDFAAQSGQSQEEIQAEVDDFLQLREEWRKENRERNLD